MDAFGYLSVLLSIIIGLAIAQVLQGYRALLLSRGRVRFDAAPLIWSVLLLLAATQAWWSSFGLREHDDWNFFAFCIVLLQMVLLYMSTAVVLPDAQGSEAVDLGDHFERQPVALFGFLLAMLVTSITKDVVLDGELPDARNLLFHLVLGAMSIVGMLVRSRAAHTALAVVAVAGFFMYIALLFLRL